MTKPHEYYMSQALELKKFECSEELPPYWDAIKYFLKQGD